MTNNNLKEEDFKNGFVAGSGLYIDDKQVATFCPQMVAIEERFDQNNRISITYKVKVIRTDGTETETKSFASLSAIDWLVDFEVYDGLQTTNEKRMIVHYLQQQCKSCKRRKIYQLTNGFHFIEGTPVMVLGDKVIKPNDQFDVESASLDRLIVDVNNKLIKDIVLDYTDKMLSFMPGVTEPLFYLSLLGGLKSLLNYNGVVSTFIGGIVGPSGHLKTTLARKYCLWTDNIEDQEISFADAIRVDTFQKKLESKANLNFLIDDFHAVSRQHTKNRYRDRLDDATRLVRDNKNVALAIITAESLEDSSIFSAYDRIFQISINRMDESELRRYKSSIFKLKDNAMGTIMYYFLNRLLDNYDEVCQFIRNYNMKAEIPEWCDASTRIPNQYQVLKLVEELFCKYVCDGDKELSKHQEFQQVLQDLLVKQAKELKKLRLKDEEERPVLLLRKLLDNTIDNPSLRICTLKSDYKDYINQAFLEDGLLRITSSALQAFLMKCLEHPVSLRKVSDEMLDAGILVTGADKRTMKFVDVRHYIINVDMLTKYCESKYGYMSI